MRRKLLPLIVLLLSAFLLLSSGPAFAGQDDVSLKDGSYELLAISARGTNVTWGWKVKLSNDVAKQHSVLLTVQLLDSSGYEIDRATKRIRLDLWETKTVTGQHKLNRELWEKVIKANYLVEITK
jgi:hypothetical protein